MRLTARSSPVVFALCAALLFPLLAEAQVFVYPRRAGQSAVRNFDFEWQHIDILVGPAADKEEAESMEKTLTPAPIPTPEGESVPGGPVVPGGQGGAQQGGDPTSADPVPTQPQPTEPGAEQPGTPIEGTEAPAAPAPAPAPAAQKVPPIPPAPVAETKPDPWGLGPKTGGVRLYFYERERPVAERAAGFIVNTYRYLVEQFEFVPSKTLPYILYNSYQEFLQTNLSPVQEGTLGFTSTQGDFRLTLPYFGDHRLFDDVSAHEMAHQFTLQAAEEMAAASGRAGNPLDNVPLWFIEGLAEFMAKRGVDQEADMLVRDLLVNPNVRKGYAMLSFYDEGPYSFVWIYKVGQLRIAFLEETYGRGTAIRILKATPQIMASGGALGLGLGAPSFGFPELIQRVTKDDPTTVALKFDAWLKKRYYPDVVEAKQDASIVKVLPEIDGVITALNASPDGNLLAYRTINLTTFDNRIYLTDRRQAGKTWYIAGDNRPGFESLHPIFGRNFDVNDNGIVYVAEKGGRDVIYWQRFRSESEKLDPSEIRRPLPPGTPVGSKPPPPPPADLAPKNPVADAPYRVRLDFDDLVEFPLVEKDLIAAYSPSFSPNGDRVAFVGMNEAGTRDVYVLDRDPSSRELRITQLTNDVYAERALGWGPGGIVFNSDATSHGKYNLFRVNPEQPGKIEQLTTEDRDHLDPDYLPDGRILFTAYHDGSAEIHEYQKGQVIRRTDITTGFFDISPGPDGGVWTLIHYAGERTPVLLSRDKLLAVEAIVQQPQGPPRSLPEQSLAASEPYRPFRWQNIDLGPIFGFAGGGTGGFAGQVFGQASDKLRNHALLLSVAAYGSFELTDGFLFYVNQESRIDWGGGLFQSIGFRIDETFDTPFLLTSAERFFGALGTVRYPLNRFQYLQSDLALGGISYFLTPGQALLYATPFANGTNQNLLEPWIAQNSGIRAQAELTLRYGYDTTRYGFSGPIAGSTLLLEGSGTVQPFDDQQFASFRLDAEHRVPLFGTTHIFGRVGAGTSFGGRLARQFYLSSFDTIRGAKFGDEQWLLGRNFVFSTVQLVVPLNQIIQVILLNNIEAIAGIDAGGVADEIIGRTLDNGQRVFGVWDKRILNVAVGVNFALGPLLFRLHFAKPLGIGAPAGTPYNSEWVTNFSLGFAGFPGFYGDRQANRPMGPARVNVSPSSLVSF